MIGVWVRQGVLLEVGKVPELLDLVVAEVDALEEVEGGAHVFDRDQLVAPEVQLTLVEGVGELGGALDQICCYFHLL